MTERLESTEGLDAAIATLEDLTKQAIAIAQHGQVVETDLLTMRIGIVAEAMRHCDRTKAAHLAPRLNGLLAQLDELSATLTAQQSALKSQIGERARRAIDAYR